MSLLHRPGRPLTIADFPPSQTPSEADLPSPAPEDALPYHRRFLPDPLTLPMDESRLPPIGIWPSALARKWTSPKWHGKLLPTRPGSLRLGFQPLHSTSGPFSVLSAILGSINYGQDTVLTLWKRAEAYLQFAWNRADCYPAHRLGLHTIHTNRHSLFVPDLRASASLYPQSPGGFSALFIPSNTSSHLLHPGGSVLWPPPGD